MKTWYQVKWNAMIANPVDYQDHTNLRTKSGEPVKISNCTTGLTVTIGNEKVVTGSVLSTCAWLIHHGVGIAL